MPNRILREAILSSESVATLRPEEEVFYRRLMSIVDDYGRHEANPQLLKSKCYPLVEQLKSSTVIGWLNACKSAGLVTHYIVGGREYVEICKFQQQVRSKSKCPDPPLHGICIADGEQLKSFAHLGVSVGVSEDVVTTLSVSTDYVTETPDQEQPKRTIPVAAILSAYHEHLPMLTAVRKMTDNRKRKLKARWCEDAERQSVEYWDKFFAYVAQSDFLTGRDNRWTACDFEWLIEPSNHVKVIEGKYENRGQA